MKKLIFVLILLFNWALVHNGTRRNDKMDDYWRNANDD